MRAPRFTPGRQPARKLARLLCAVGVTVALLLAASANALALPPLLTFVTQASPSVSLGGTISDTAVVIGDAFGTPTPGKVTFNLYGPDDTTCAKKPVHTVTVPVGKQSTPSGAFTPKLPGTYIWVASFTPDKDHPTFAPAVGRCSESNEAVLVTAVTPVLTTAASPSVAVGGMVTDTATLTGGQNPTGSVEFGLFAPNDPSCSGGVVFRSTVPITDPSSVVSESYSPPVPGTYHWEARYVGDHTNGAVRSACNDAGESVVVTPGPSPPAAPPSSGSPAAGGAGGGAGGASPECDAVTTAHAVLAGLAAVLTGKPAAFKSTCSAGLRIVLRAKEIRPGNPGSPRHDGFTTMANTLTHISPSGPALNFSLNPTGLALRNYAQGTGRSLVAFLIVHVRPDKSQVSTESLQIITLG